MSDQRQQAQGRKSIFRSLFIPLFLIMLLQGAIFYFAAVYGGIEESLNQNAADILASRLANRRTELETRFNNRSFNLDDCQLALDKLYANYESEYGQRPLAGAPELQIRFLSDSADLLVDSLRFNQSNGVFLILNDQTQRQQPDFALADKKYGLCIRDLDQESNYTGRQDLLLERSPSSIVGALGCSLDSWWEAWYSFDSEQQGDYYYYPLNAAWDYPAAAGRDLAYFSGLHQISGSDLEVVSYSIPLIAADGYPYGVLGVELSAKYLATLLPNDGASDPSRSCYVLALNQAGSELCAPLVASGALYTRCFGPDSTIPVGQTTATGGFSLLGLGDIELYGHQAEISIYNNNNPFESQRLVLLALVESDSLFAHIERIKLTLLAVALFSLILGVAAILLVSRHFAAPITALAAKVRDMQPQAGFRLDRLGISEIDQLVDSIEELNRKVSRNSARTEFFSRMSHDMRTPMNAIISFSSPSLLEGADAATKDDYLAKIHTSGDYLLGLINEVLDITKIDSNKVELRPEAVQAHLLCDTVLPIIHKLARQKNIDFSSEIDLPDDLYVMADAHRLSQVVMNLLANAVKFTPDGGQVRFSLSLCQEDAEACRCRLVVADNGVGMSEAFLKELYVPFEQENSGGEGTGLGLAIAQRLVELMGGSIDCVSRKNVGTTFTVELPLPKYIPAAAQLRATPALPDLGPLRGKRVLVCEDNDVNSQIVINLLEKVGALTELAVNGQQAVDIFTAAAPGTFDAVLMDIRMPVVDGLSATRSIRALPRPDAATVPIIAMTANAFTEDVEDSRKAGMTAYLSKPIDINKFFSILLRAINKESIDFI